MRKCICILFITILIGQDLDQFKKHIRILSDDNMKGRSSLAPEIWMAANYIADQFSKIGLDKPYSDSYFQTFNIPNRQDKIANVIAVIKAASSTKESLVFTAHYDGLGIGKADASGDSIYNGAVDNAIGTAALIELTRYYKNSPAPPVNLVFIAIGAEEGGTYGSRFYAQNPLYPLNEIRMVLNIDGFSIHGDFETVMIMPRQSVTFPQTILSVLNKMNLTDATPDWADRMNTSFDTKEFLQRGIPAVTIWSGDKLVGKTLKESREYANTVSGGRHHKPSDEFTDKWNFAGVTKHLNIYMALADFYMTSSIKEKVLNKSLFIRNRNK